jgi:hypothetical protein
MVDKKSKELFYREYNDDTEEPAGSAETAE